MNTPPHDAVTPVMLADALEAHVGKGRLKMPTADDDAVRQRFAGAADIVLDEVWKAILTSDSITLEELQTRGGPTRDAFAERMRELRPDLHPRAVDALGWRWAFLAFYC